MEDIRHEDSEPFTRFNKDDTVSKVIRPGEDTTQYVVEFPESSYDDPIWATILAPSGMEWVRLPPDIGGGKAHIITSRTDRCPKCGLGVRVYYLDTHGLIIHSQYSVLCVAECNSCGWVWHRRRLGIDQDEEDEVPPQKTNTPTTGDSGSQGLL